MRRGQSTKTKDWLQFLGGVSAPHMVRGLFGVSPGAVNLDVFLTSLLVLAHFK